MPPISECFPHSVSLPIINRKSSRTSRTRRLMTFSLWNGKSSHARCSCHRIEERARDEIFFYCENRLMKICVYVVREISRLLTFWQSLSLCVQYRVCENRRFGRLAGDGEYLRALTNVWHFLTSFVCRTTNLTLDRRTRVAPNCHWTLIAAQLFLTVIFLHSSIMLRLSSSSFTTWADIGHVNIKFVSFECTRTPYESCYRMWIEWLGEKWRKKNIQKSAIVQLVDFFCVKVHWETSVAAIFDKLNSQSRARRWKRLGFLSGFMR